MARTPSESETTALSVQPDDRTAKTPEPKAPTGDGHRVADLLDDGYVAIEMEDGRHFRAKLADGVEVKRHQRVDFTSDGEDKGGAPKDAIVTGVRS